MNIETPIPHDDTPQPAPRQKSEYARQFLRLLGRDKFEFRALAESPAVKGKANAPQMIRRTGTFDQHKDELRRLNDAGYAICVQVNESDGKGYNSSQIIAAPCLFADFDGVPMSHLDRLPCKPHAVFETSPGKIHAYWRLTDLCLTDFTPLQKRLIGLFESDRLIHDRARVMRLPGFLHQKNAEKPFLVAPVEVNDRPSMTKAEFGVALDAAEKARGIPSERCAPQSRPSSSATGDLSRSASVLKFLIAEGHVDPGCYEDWHRTAMALKHTHGEEGWPLWHSISAAAHGYDGEEACRAKWDSFGDTPGPRLTMASYFALAKEHGWQPMDAGVALGRGGKKEKDPDPAVVVLKQAEEAGDEFWLDENDRAHVSIQITLADSRMRLQHMQIDSSRYRKTISKRYYRGSGIKVLAAEQENRAISLLEQTAEEDGRRFSAFLRVGMDQGTIYVDLGREDGQCVKVAADGWSIVREVPIRFLDSGHGELPIPEAGGEIEDFRKHFDLESDSLVRLMAFCMASYHPEGANPILLLEGGQGDGKSTMGDMVLALTDPPRGRKAGRMTLTNSERDLHIHGQNSHLLYFDNVSYLDGPLSDMLCRCPPSAPMAQI